MTSRPLVVATASVPCGKHEGALSLDLEVQVLREACEAAGLRPKDLEAIVLVPPGYRRGFAPIRAGRVCERLGCWPRTALEVDIGGMSALSALHVAASEIASGRASVAAVVGAQAERTVAFDPAEVERFTFMNAMFGPWQGPFGVVGALHCYAMSAQRYMYEHGVGPDEIARVPVVLQSHAARNPKAELRTPISVEDVLASRVVSPPIHLFEAAPWSDGACAVVLASADWAREKAIDGVAVTGWGEAHAPSHMLIHDHDLTTFPWIGAATREALDRAGRSLDDVDVAEIYGAFAASELMTYEAMGFFSPGEAAKAVADGRTTFGGEVVLNPSGGRICFGHPPPATPLYEVEEVFLQLSEAAGDRQVAGARVGLVQAEHGMMNGAGVAVLEA